MDKIKEALNVGKSQLISSKHLYEIGQYRDSITLSYYAMYSSAFALLLKKDISPKTHEGTLSQLSKEYVKTGLFNRKIYNYLHAAKSLRNKSSYDYLADFTDEQTYKLLLQAEEFILEVESLL